jgi:DNA-binding SARP family transcriptional activator
VARCENLVPEMEFRILGPLQVFDDGRALTPRRAKQRALLAVLLLHANEPVAGDLLVDALWGERPPATALTALHGHVSALRKLLGTERIVTSSPGYLVSVQPGELDAHRFENLASKARAKEDPAERGVRAT